MTEEVIVFGYPGEQMSSHTIIEGLEPGARYEFQVSLTTDQESAYSNKSGVILIPRPSGKVPHSFQCTCENIKLQSQHSITLGMEFRLCIQLEKNFSVVCLKGHALPPQIRTFFHRELEIVYTVTQDLCFDMKRCDKATQGHYDG